MCIHSQLERVKSEGVVDFFQFVKSSRIHRTSLVMETVIKMTTYANPYHACGGGVVVGLSCDVGGRGRALYIP